MRPIHVFCLIVFVATALPTVCVIFVLGLMSWIEKCGFGLPIGVALTAVLAALLGGCFTLRKP